MSRDERAFGDPPLRQKMADAGLAENLGHPTMRSVRMFVARFLAGLLCFVRFWNLCVAAVALSGVRVVLGMGR